MVSNRSATSTVVKLKPAVHAELQAIAQGEKRAMGDVVADLLRQYRRDAFWKRARESMQRLQADPAALAGYLDELREWDSMPDDGLAGEEAYYTPEEEAEIEATHARAQGW